MKSWVVEVISGGFFILHDIIQARREKKRQRTAREILGDVPLGTEEAKKRAHEALRKRRGESP